MQPVNDMATIGNKTIDRSETVDLSTPVASSRLSMSLNGLMDRIVARATVISRCLPDVEVEAAQRLLQCRLEITGPLVIE